MSLSVYVTIAVEDNKVKDCLVLSDHAAALRTYHEWQNVWGGEFVAMFSRAVDGMHPLLQYDQYSIEFPIR